MTDGLAGAAGFAGKRVVVTGGTRGIGRAVALAFARSGARLVVSYRSDGEQAKTLGAGLEELGVEFELVQADLTTREGAELLAATAAERFGGVDVLVNNLGVDGHVPFAKLSEAEWHRVLDHNATSAYLVTQAVLETMGAAGEGGAIVNIGASVALRGRPLGVHYSTSKAALVGFTRALAKELGPRGIRVNLVAPGVTETEPGAGLPPQLAAKLTALTALGRLGQPEDVAGAVLYLAGDSASYVTGTTIEVDGGI
ncbi:SDR family NAD(P)-dependent oxidoreductase [Streptomyces sp. NPDC056773]|uniref:SDR family NAD(P)-dependent oxidoreductase n=1 Tax=unclassified Streptomyces TaxID=2593676 RepID=UPI0036C47235